MPKRHRLRQSGPGRAPLSLWPRTILGEILLALLVGACSTDLSPTVIPPPSTSSSLSGPSASPSPRPPRRWLRVEHHIPWPAARGSLLPWTWGQSLGGSDSAPRPASMRSCGVIGPHMTPGSDLPEGQSKKILWMSDRTMTKPLEITAHPAEEESPVVRFTFGSGA